MATGGMWTRAATTLSARGIVRPARADFRRFLRGRPLKDDLLPHGRRTPEDIALLILIATVLALPSLRSPLESMDESVVLVYAEQVRAGMIPHRDFFTVYGPAPYYMLAGLFSTLGSALVVERLLGLLLHIVIAVGCYAVGRSRGRTAGLSAGTLSLALMFPLGTVAYAWLGAAACLIGVLALAQLNTRSGDLLTGLLAGLAASFRPEVSVVAAVVLVPLVWRSRRGIWIIPAFLVGTAPVLLLWIAAGDRMWRNILLGRVGVNGSLNFADDPLRTSVLLGAVLVVTGALLRRTWGQRSRATVMSALLALGVLPQTLQRIDTQHALYTLCITGPLLLISVVSTTPPDKAALRRRQVVTVSVGLTLAGAVGIALLRPPDLTLVNAWGRSALLTSQDAVAFSETKRELLVHSHPGATLFVGSTDMSGPSLNRTSAYFLFPEFHARAYFLELPVGVSERPHSGLVDDLRAADVLLLSRMPDGLADHLFPYVPPGSSEANDVVRSEFCAVAETEWGVIYEHRTCA